MEKRVKFTRQQKIAMAFIFVFILIAVYLWDFSIDIKHYEQKRGVETLSDLAVQGAAIVENKIEKAESVLWTASRALRTEDNLSDLKVIRYLREIIADENTDMIRMGIVTLDGKAKVTDGREMDLSDKTFFEESSKGKIYVSSVVQQSQKPWDNGNLVVSVPVYGFRSQVKGVLYGIIQTENFELYTNTRLGMIKKDQYIHIIDNEGNYIVRSKSQNNMLEGDNLYKGLAGAKPTVTVKDIRESVAKKEAILAQIHKGEDVRYVYFAPMELNNWCVVTVLTREEINEQVGFSEDVIVYLVMKVLATFAILGLFVCRLMMKEKREIMTLHEELVIQEKTLKIAISGIGNFVFTYDSGTKALEFMNYDKEKIPIPQRVENFPHRVKEFFSQESQSYREIQRLFQAIEAGAEEVEGELLFSFRYAAAYYHVQLTRIFNDEHKTVRILGTLNDITQEKKKEQKLKKQAVFDPLTQAYNRGVGMEKINEILSNNKEQNCAFLLLDLDNFKMVNDTLGHMMGDQVLMDVVRILKNHVSQEDIVCRLGGDEFAVFLVGKPKEDVAQKVKNLLETLNLTYEKNGVSENVSASMGITMAPEQGSDFQTLYEKADVALYTVKKSSKNGYRFYQEQEKDNRSDISFNGRD